MISGMNQGLEFIQFISTGVPEQNQWTPNNVFWDSRKILNLFCDWIFKIGITVTYINSPNSDIFDSEYSLV